MRILPVLVHHFPLCQTDADGIVRWQAHICMRETLSSSDLCLQPGSEVSWALRQRHWVPPDQRKFQSLGIIHDLKLAVNLPPASQNEG